MFLRKTSANYKVGGSNSFKYKLKCSEKITEQNPTTQGWLVIKQLLMEKHPVLLGELIKLDKTVVVKFGTPDEIKKDYAIAQKIQDIPNMIKYYCVFTCNDSHVMKMASGDFTYNIRPFMCDGKGVQISSIIMPYYPLSNINKYKWTRQTFPVLKNVLKQVVTAMLYAYAQHNFIHGDLHLENILLRKTKKKSATYNDVTIPIDTLYAILLDFGKSKCVPGFQYLVYKDIRRLLNLVPSMEESDIVVYTETKAINKIENDNTPITYAVFQIIWNIIDDMVIGYAKSERPPMPW